MADDVIKSLKWLIFNFPEIENPKDDADKISNCIHLYCQNAVDELNRQKAEIAVLSMKNADLDIENKAKSVFLNRNLPNLIKNAKTEVVREFSVAVQDAFAEYFKIDDIPVCYVIDKILGVEEAKIKELVGDDK